LAALSTGSKTSPNSADPPRPHFPRESPDSAPINSVRADEVDLGLDVPEDAIHVTSSSRGFGRYQRPIFPEGRPSVRTMSAVKSFEPRISDEPTP